MITGPLFDAGYLRSLLLIGCTLIVLGVSMLSLATTYWHVFLAQGLCVGLGSGLVYVPSLAFIATLFPRSTRPWAIGVANGGGSIGGIIFTFMLRRLQPTIGFAWAVRSIALVVLVLCLIALVIILPHRPVVSKRRAMFDPRALFEPSFAMFAIAQLFTYVAFYIPPFYVPTYAKVALGRSQNFAFDSLVSVSVGSFFGRTIPMLAAARFGSVQLYLAALLSAVIILFSWIAVHNVGGFIVFCVMYGLASGVLVAAPSSAIAHPVLSPSLNVIGTRMGMCWMFGGIGVLIGSPIAGALVDVRKADFTPAQVFAASMVVAASLCLIVPLIAVIRYDRKHRFMEGSVQSECESQQVQEEEGEMK